MKKRIRRTYTAEEKNEAVIRCLEMGATPFSRESGIPLITLNSWLKLHKKGIELKKTSSGKTMKEQ